MRTFLLFPLLAWLAFGCKTMNKTPLSKYKPEKTNGDTLALLLARPLKNVITFYPKDTQYYFKPGFKVTMFKKSFSDIYGEPYTGRISFRFNYFNNETELARLFPASVLEISRMTVKGLLIYKLEDSTGHELKFSKNYGTAVLFPYHKGYIGSSWGFHPYDSVKHRYYEYDCWTKWPEKPDLSNLSSFLTFPDLDIKADTSKINYKGRVFTKSGIVNARLSMEHALTIFTGIRKDKLKQVKINVAINDAKIPLSSIKTILYSPVQNLFFVAKLQPDGTFIFTYPYSFNTNTISLPLNFKYTVLCYGFSGAKTYYYFHKNLSFNEGPNNLNVKLQEGKFAELLHKLDKLKEK